MSGILEQINNPDDLKKLPLDELKTLAEQIRQFIIATVSETGGHLASNLGVVEATLAMHYVFDFKKDKLLWDVGHQCYTHKIITGRKEAFKRLRKSDGISGFPNPAESEYDQFAVGHAGTAISTAIGMALGQVHNKSSDKIVAFVGDASIVNGAAFEGLNNLGLVKRQLLIVLNDNSMAIDATPGSLAKYFSRIRLSQTYEDMRKTTSNILEHMPVIGKTVEEAIERIKKTIRMALPAGQLFESLNIPYFGPVDGHNIGSLTKLFGELAKLNHPAILHLYTKKGKGFTPADKAPSRFHSTGPFTMNGDDEEPDWPNKKESFTNVFGRELLKLAEKDSKIVAITSAMSSGTGLEQFRKKFSDRFYDVGIAESAAVDIAAGLAKSGLRPVVCVYSTFLQRAFDQIFQEVALQNLPVVFCVDRAGVVGSDGPTHHGVMDIGALRMMPNMVLTAPANAPELKQALKFASDAERPVVIRYPKDKITLGNCLSNGDNLFKTPFELGKSLKIKTSENSAVAIVAYGSVLTEAIEAAEILGKENIDVDVINARFAAPMDEEIIRLLEKGKGIITVEDHRLDCGFGSAVLEAATKILPNGITRPIKLLAVPKKFVKHDLRKSQLIKAAINVDNIAEQVRKISSMQ